MKINICSTMNALFLVEEWIVAHRETFGFSTTFENGIFEKVIKCNNMKS